MQEASPSDDPRTCRAGLPSRAQPAATQHDRPHLRLDILDQRALVLAHVVF
jgi:hypothetical protein